MAFEHDKDSNNDGHFLLGEQRGEREEKLSWQSSELCDPLSFLVLFSLYLIQHVLEIERVSFGAITSGQAFLRSEKHSCRIVMGKQGPCCHCGVTSTPLWRNGPPHKPVLCNACGSRWRTKGTLVNYVPLHARGCSSTEIENRGSHEGARPFRCTKLGLLHAVKPKPEASNVGDHVKHKSKAISAIHEKDTWSGSTEEDAGNRSSSMSGISYSESSTQFDSTDGNEITGSVQSHAWDTQIPSRKRTSLKRPSPSSVEKLQKELYNILHEQESSHLSQLSEVLLFDSETPIGSAEIGLGSMLIKPPLLSGPEEESEGCSFPSDSKQYMKNKQSTEVSLPLVQSESCKSSSSVVSNDRLEEVMEMRKQSILKE